jgi:hypothetical protein
MRMQTIGAVGAFVLLVASAQQPALSARGAQAVRYPFTVFGSQRPPSACDPSSYCVTISPGHPAQVGVCYELNPPSGSCQPGSWYWLTPGIFYQGRRHDKGPVTTIDLSFNPAFGNATVITVTDNGASKKHSYFASILNCTNPSGGTCFDSGVLRISVQ